MTTGLLIPAQGYLSVSNSNFNNLENNDFTIMGWICSTNAPGNGLRNIVHKGASFAGQPPTISLNLNSSNNAIARMVLNGSSYSLPSIRQLSTNEWQHVAFSKSGSTYSLYVNGHLDAQTNIPGDFNGSARTATSFYISYTDLAARALNDTIANLDIYNAPLDPELIHYAYARKTANFKMISNTDPTEALESLTLDANGHVDLSTDLPWTNTPTVQCCYGDQDGRYIPYPSSSNTISVRYTPSPGYTNESSICVHNGDNYLKVRLAVTNNIP
jgi:hypothetical protein